jgi:hypothetical protein
LLTTVVVLVVVLVGGGAGISDHVWTLEEMCTLLPVPVAAARKAEKGMLLKALAGE